MNSAAKNADCVTAQERIALARRESDRNPNWAAAAAVLALLLLAYQSVQHRDAMVLIKEYHAAELAAKDRELALYKPAPQLGRCRNYTTVPYDQAVEHACHKTVSRM